MTNHEAANRMMAAMVRAIYDDPLIGAVADDIWGFGLHARFELRVWCEAAGVDEPVPRPNIDEEFLHGLHIVPDVAPQSAPAPPKAAPRSLWRRIADAIANAEEK